MSRTSPLRLLLPLAATLGCSPKSPSDQATQALRGIRSWTATATLAARSWVQGRVPTQFATSTLKSALKSVRPLDSSLRASGDVPTSLAPTMADPARRPTATLTRLDSAISRGNRSAAAVEVAQLDTLDALLRAALSARGVSP